MSAHTEKSHNEKNTREKTRIVKMQDSFFKRRMLNIWEYRKYNPINENQTRK